MKVYEKYALNLDENNRIVTVHYPSYDEDKVKVDSLPLEDDTHWVQDYLYVNGEYVYDPLPHPEPEPSQLDRIEAQGLYTAMMTDTLLEE